MRLVQVSIPSGKRDTVLAVLDDEAIDYAVADETGGREYEAIAYVPLPTNAVEPVLDSLRDAGVDDDALTVIVEASTVVSRQFDDLAERYEEEADEDRIAREELTTAASGMMPSRRNYLIMTAISALIATAGLLLDSPAVVVGSMVIAPLVGPAMAASVGTVVDDVEMFATGVRYQIVGILLAVLTATLFALLVRHAHLIPPLEDVATIPQVRERLAPDFLSLAVALGAGVAGVVSLTSGVSTALVGVMIAVALIPPAATVGIGIAWGRPLMTLGSGVLVAVNVLSINLAAVAVLWYTGYRPERWFRQDAARSATIKRVAVLLVAILALSAFLGGITLDSFDRATTEERLQQDARTVVAAEDGTGRLRVLDVRVEYDSTVPFRQADRVVVTVGVPPGESVSGLADRLDTRLDGTAGHDIRTQVRYVATEES